MTLDVEKMKSVLWWGVPLVLASTVGFMWTFFDDVPRMYAELHKQSPSLRIRTGSLVMPIGAIMFFSILLLMPFRIFKIEKWAARIEKYLLIGSLIVFVVSLPIVLIGGHILQQTYLPGMGYTECNKLNGAPSVYFTDWVKNPAWCVYKKDHKWVREQAAKAGVVNPPKAIDTPSRTR
jgi:hypothetical protein